CCGVAGHDCRGREVSRPNVVMDWLDIPFGRGCHRVARYDGIAEKIISFAIESVVVAGRTAKDGIEGTALCIDSHIEAPIVDASAIFPTVGGPRLVTGFAGLRNRVKLPDFFARPSVICARGSG